MADYNNHKVVRKLLYNMDNLKKCGSMGDKVAHSIYIDLNIAMSGKALSRKQLKYLNLWLYGYNTIEIAAHYKISHSAVTKTIGKAIENLSHALEVTNSATSSIDIYKG